MEEPHCQKQHFKAGKFDYLICGHGQPILFFHGYGLSPLSYINVIHHLAKNHLVIAPYLYHQYCFESLTNLLDYLNIKNSICIVGHSMGAKIAVKFTIEHPTRVNKLVIIDGLILPLGKNPLQALIDLSKDKILRFINPQGRRQTLTMFVDSFNNLVRYPKTLYRWLLEGFNTDLSKEISQIKIDTLILWGKNDRLLPSKHAFVINKLIKNSSVVLQQGGHTWIFETPEIVEEKISQFINEN
jgi:pimeloyl-ACP methyl ester carboxylesterase